MSLFASCSRRTLPRVAATAASFAVSTPSSNGPFYTGGVRWSATSLNWVSVARRPVTPPAVPVPFKPH